MATQPIGVKAIFDLSQWNNGVSSYISSLGKANAASDAAARGIGFIGQVAIGATRRLGELAVDGLVAAGRAAFRFGADIAKAAVDVSPLGDTLDRLKPSLVEVTRVSFAPLFDSLDKLVQRAAPSFLAFVGAAEETLGGLAIQGLAWGEGFINSFAAGMWAAVGNVISVLTSIAQAITYWLAPGSPPRILPDLDQWGTDAMNEWLNGFNKADFGIFNDLSNTLTGLIRSLPVAGGDKLGVIPRILGAREGIAKAVSELRTAGAVSEATLQSIIGNVGTADDSVRAYVESLVKLNAADQVVSEAQARLTAATKAYNDALKPLDSQLANISESQQQLADDQAKYIASLILADPGATAAEKRNAQLEIERINAEAARRAAVAKGEAEVSAATEALDTAKQAQTAAQDQYDTDRARIAALTETNNLLREQLALIESLNKEPAAGKTPSGGAPKPPLFSPVGGFDLSKLIPPDIQSKLDELVAAFTAAGVAIGVALDPAVQAWNTYVIPGWDSLVANFQSTTPAITSAIGEMVAFAVTQLGTALPTIFQNLGASLTALGTIWQNNHGWILQVATFTWKLIVTTITGSFTLLSGIITMGLQLLAGDWRGAWDTMLRTLESFFNQAGAIVDTNWDTFSETWANNFQMLSDILTAALQNMSDSLNDWLNTTSDNILARWTQFWTDLANTAASIVANVLASTNSLFNLNGLTEGVGGAAGAGASGTGTTGAGGGGGGGGGGTAYTTAASGAGANVTVQNTFVTENHYNLGGVTSNRTSQGISNDFAILMATAGG